MAQEIRSLFQVDPRSLEHLCWQDLPLINRLAAMVAFHDRSRPQKRDGDAEVHSDRASYHRRAGKRPSERYCL